jgi:hypothetical protein
MRAFPSAGACCTKPRIPSGVEIYLGLEPIDLRWGFDRLSGLVDERIGRAARSGALFCRKRKSALKILFFDGTWLFQFYMRLDRHVFRVRERFGKSRRFAHQSVECG